MSKLESYLKMYHDAEGTSGDCISTDTENSLTISTKLNEPVAQPTAVVYPPADLFADSVQQEEPGFILHFVSTFINMTESKLGFRRNSSPALLFHFKTSVPLTIQYDADSDPVRIMPGGTFRTETMSDVVGLLENNVVVDMRILDKCKKCVRVLGCAISEEKRSVCGGPYQAKEVINDSEGQQRQYGGSGNWGR